MLLFALSVLPIAAIEISLEHYREILRQHEEYSAEGTRATNRIWALAFLLVTYLVFVVPIWFSLILAGIVKTLRRRGKLVGD